MRWRRKVSPTCRRGGRFFRFLTVQENLETGFACLPRSKHRIPDEIFDLFPVLKDFAHRRGGDLSAGSSNSLPSHGPWSPNPSCFLLDEPTEGIQPNIIKQIGDVISTLRERGQLAIVLVEQYFDFAFDLGDRFTVLERGAVKLEGKRAVIERSELLSAVSV